MVSVDKSLSTDKCKNCGHENIGSYCPDCGQKTYRERFTLKAFFRVFLNAFDLERGFFHTLIMLFKDPGKIINDYLNGNTKKYFNPLKYLLILAGINAFLVVWLNTFDAQQETTIEIMGEQYRSSFESSKMSEYVKNYLNILELIILPVFSLTAMWFYKKKKLFYGEHIIILCFLFAQTSVIAIVMQPLYYVFPIFLSYSWIISHMILFAYLTYGFNKVYKRSVFISLIGAITIYTLGLILFMVSFFILFFIITVTLKSLGVPVEKFIGQ